MLSLFVIFSFFSFSQNLSDIPGLIPLQNQRQAASDLVYQGRVLQPDDARSLVEAGKVQDLSLLDPIESSILWKNKMGGAVETKEESDLRQSLNQKTFHFVGYTIEAIGRMGFTLKTTNENGNVEIFRARLSTRNQNILLRKNLLRKLGYNIPNTSWAPKLKIRFKGDFSKDEFIKEIESLTFLDSKRWISENRDAELVVKNLILYHGAEDNYYNFARGDINSEVILNRRLINSLLVPYNLLAVPESVNIFSWSPGKIFNGQVSLPYRDAEVFSTSFADAKWIARRILSLSRKDFEEIVAKSYYPKEVELLLIEKIISRRNFLMRFLNLEEEFDKIEINEEITYSEKLVKGKLIGEKNWPSYVQNYVYGDPESPLSDAMVPLFKSKFITNLISNAVTKFNEKYITRTDIAFEVFDHQLDLAVRQFANFIETGEVKKVPFGFWSTPTYSGNVIAAREVITGPYMGTDNLVQLADVVGFSMDYGLFIGADGLPSNIGFSGGAKAFYNRTYAHIKPIQNIRVALKEPFRNILVPKYKKDLVSHLNFLFTKEYQELPEEEQLVKVEKALGTLNEKLNVGESIVISSNLGANLVASPSVSFSEAMSLQLSWSNSQILINRLHLFRNSENSIQVYYDPGRMSDSTFYVGLKNFIPFFSFQSRKLRGKVDTHLFTLSLNKSQLSLNELEDNLRAISRVFIKSKLDALRQIQNPYIIHHDFAQKINEAKLFHLRELNQKSKDYIDVVHPEGYEKNFIRYTTGKRSGKNYEELSIDIFNGILEEYDYGNYSVATSSGRDPADTLFGESVSHQMILEAEVSKEGNGKERFEDLFLSIVYTWRNWKISKEDLLNVLFDINQWFSREIFYPEEFHDTKEVQLSTIQTSINVYREGIDYFSGFQADEVRNILDTKGVFPQYIVLPHAGRQSRRITKERQERRDRIYTNIFVEKFKDFQKLYKNGEVDKTFDSLTKLLMFAERLLPREDLFALFGGESNLFIQGQVMGFRQGDERESGSLMSSSIGRIGNDKGNGPLQYIRNKIGITEAEMFIYWLMNRL